MSYVAFDQTKPDGTANGSVTLQEIRQNLAAIRDIAALGSAPGWNYSWSGGTADKPNIMLWNKGVEWLRSSNTWGITGGGADNITEAVLAYSSNNGSTYFTVGTQTIAYDANGNVTSTTWAV